MPRLRKIRFGDRAPERLGHGEQATGGLGRSGRGRRLRLMLRCVPRHGEEAPRLLEHIVQGRQALIGGDQIEKIAMLARRSVGPFADRAPCPSRDRAGGQRGCVPVRSRHPPPASSHLGVDRWRGNGGRPPRHFPPAGGPARMRCSASRPPRKKARHPGSTKRASWNGPSRRAKVGRGLGYSAAIAGRSTAAGLIL